MSTTASSFKLSVYSCWKAETVLISLSFTGTEGQGEKRYLGFDIYFQVNKILSFSPKLLSTVNLICVENGDWGGGGGEHTNILGMCAHSCVSI